MAGFRPWMRRRPAPAGIARHAGRVAARAGIAEWPGLLERGDVLLLDTETTGIGRGDEVIEVAIINTRGEALLERLAMPRAEISRGAERVHGLTREKLQRLGAGPWPDVYRSLAPMLRNAAQVIVYNLAFDRRLLQQTCRRHRLRMPPGVAWRCALRDYRQYRAGQRGNGLAEAVARECPGAPAQTHRALGDCQLVLALMRAVTAREV